MAAYHCRLCLIKAVLFVQHYMYTWSYFSFEGRTTYIGNSLILLVQVCTWAVPWILGVCLQISHLIACLFIFQSWYSCHTHTTAKGKTTLKFHWFCPSVWLCSTEVWSVFRYDCLKHVHILTQYILSPELTVQIFWAVFRLQANVFDSLIGAVEMPVRIIICRFSHLYKSCCNHISNHRHPNVDKIWFHMIFVPE